MNLGTGRSRRRWPDPPWWFGAICFVAILLLRAVLAVVAGILLVLAFRAAPDTVIAKAGRVAIALALLSWLGLWVRRGVRAVRRARTRRVDRDLPSTNPPIEQIALELRRMLWRHDMLVRSTDVSTSAGQLRAVEIRIAQRAVQAAHALEVAHPDLPAYGGFDTVELRRLLHDLEAEGLVLPPEVGLMAPDSRS